MTEPGWEGAVHCAQLRSMVDTSPWQEGLEIAETIPLMWYRVQSICHVAIKAPDERVDELLKRATADAASDSDSYRSVGVLAWVVEAAIARQRQQVALEVVETALNASSSITPVKSRASALELLLARAIPLGDRPRRLLADQLLAAALILSKDPVKRWRKWGATYAKRAAHYLPTPIASELVTKHFGEMKAQRLCSNFRAPGV